jgi:hypothetical protein
VLCNSGNLTKRLISVRLRSSVRGKDSLQNFYSKTEQVVVYLSWKNKNKIKKIKEKIEINSNKKMILRRRIAETADEIYP